MVAHHTSNIMFLEGHNYVALGGVYESHKLQSIGGEGTPLRTPV